MKRRLVEDKLLLNSILSAWLQIVDWTTFEAVVNRFEERLHSGLLLHR